MKMLEKIKGYQKEYVFEMYTRIVEEFKDYEKVSKVKMIEAVYKVYSTPEAIVDICTDKELKFLKLVVNQDEKYKEEKYSWEKKYLAQ